MMATKIEERAIEIEAAEGAHRQHLLDEWRGRYGYEYPQYNQWPDGEKSICQIRPGMQVVK